MGQRAGSGHHEDLLEKTTAEEDVEEMEREWALPTQRESEGSPNMLMGAGEGNKKKKKKKKKKSRRSQSLSALSQRLVTRSQSLTL
ncbi:hypothetical protein K469DRAFT_718269, partial [Zopfia rhizophila CBS 207.26]